MLGRLLSLTGSVQSSSPRIVYGDFGACACSCYQALFSPPQESLGTRLASNLNKAYSSEGVPTLNVAGEVEFPKSLWSTVQSHKVQEAKIFETTVISLLLVDKCTAVTIFGHFFAQIVIATGLSKNANHNTECAYTYTYVLLLT